MMVMAVRGIEIAASSQALVDTCILPPSVVFTNWVEKKFWEDFRIDLSA